MNKLDMYNFVRWAVVTVQNNLPYGYEDAEVVCQEIDNSSGPYIGLYLKRPGMEIDAVPVANLDLFYERYLDDTPLEVIKGALLGSVTRMNVDITHVQTMLSDYEKLKDSLFISVASAEKLGDMLDRIPHRDVEDMVIMYRAFIDTDKNDTMSASVIITNEMIESLGISAETLEHDAMRQAPNLLPSMCCLLNDMVLSMTFGTDTPVLSGRGDGPAVITNETGAYGAAALFYPGTMEKISDYFGGDFVVLPSSIHELIAMPARDADTSMLKQMVQAINFNVVSDRDQLTDNVYYYDAREKVFETAENHQKRIMGERIDGGYREDPALTSSSTTGGRDNEISKETREIER